MNSCCGSRALWGREKSDPPASLPPEKARLRRLGPAYLQPAGLCSRSLSPCGATKPKPSRVHVKGWPWGTLAPTSSLH